MLNKFAQFVLIIFLSFSCAKRDPETGKKILEETNPDIRAKNYSDLNKQESGGLFGATKEFQFSSSNVLWRASLEVIDFIPLNNVDYSGGVIVSDWYSSKNSKDSIKLTINFLSNDISPNSIKINSFIKKCDATNNCFVNKGSDEFNDKIKDQIIVKARELNVNKQKK